MGRTSSELETCLKRNLSILELLERLCVLLSEKTSVKLDVMEEKFCIHRSKSVQTAVHRLHYEHPRFLLLEASYCAFASERLSREDRGYPTKHDFRTLNMYEMCRSICDAAYHLIEGENFQTEMRACLGEFEH